MCSSTERYWVRLHVRGAVLGVPGAKDGDELVALEMLEVEDGDEDVKGFESVEGIVEGEGDEDDEEQVKVFLPSWNGV
ncbi:hypothetical protein QBC38DRAFT_462113 [Podospora fimiseda]|uniref:Uncharacterized protein n=1 Tax=Podospora fimiseda TaxID=252190 RepID=A0AAN6YMR9_9PEZI|nr:hypothetical protein QBC38DRAFT_462113 [Podospora fimiseda]